MTCPFHLINVIGPSVVVDQFSAPGKMLMKQRYTYLAAIPSGS